MKLFLRHWIWVLPLAMAILIGLSFCCWPRAHLTLGQRTFICFAKDGRLVGYVKRFDGGFERFVTRDLVTNEPKLCVFWRWRSSGGACLEFYTLPIPIRATQTWGPYRRQDARYGIIQGLELPGLYWWMNDRYAGLNPPGDHDMTAYVQVSGWLAILLAFIPPLISTWRTTRRKAKNKCGLCPGCGYDLRAHKLGDRCPECGAAVSATMDPESPVVS